MSIVIPTLSGAGFIAQAGPQGPYVPIRYFLPVYDHRVDPLVHSDSIVMNVSAADPTSAANPIGEIIYNTSALNAASPGSQLYTVYTNELLNYDASQSLSGDGSHKQVIGSSFDAVTTLNKLNGTPLSHVVSGTSFTYLGSNWLVNDYIVISGSNANPYSPESSRNKFFRVQSYGPLTSAAGGSARGVFKIRLPKSEGNFKFNKIALYASRFLADGSEDTGTDPVLFAIVVLNRPVLKTTDSTGMNNFELDLELEFFSQGAASQVSFLGNDYWNRYNNSVWFDGNVSIASLSAVPGSWQAHSRLNITVGPAEAAAGLSHMRLTTDNIDSYVDTFIEEFSSMVSVEQVSSKNSLSYYFLTSAVDTGSNFSQFEIYLNGSTGSRNLMLGWNDSSGTSFYSGLYIARDDIYDKMSFQVDTDSLATFRGSQLSAHAFLVLGRDSTNIFYHPSKFLTVHGGSLFVGSTLVSGSLSGNETWRCNYLYTTNDVNATGYVASNIGILAYGSNQESRFDRLRIVTSGDFRGPVTFTGEISGNNSITARTIASWGDINVGDQLVVAGGIHAWGFNQMFLLDQMRILVSADFQSQVTINHILNVSGININENIKLLGTARIQKLHVVNTSDLVGNTTLWNPALALSNFSCSAFVFSDYGFVTFGDVYIRGDAAGLRLNTATSDPGATAGVKAVAAGSTTINTTAVKTTPAKSLIFISCRGNFGGTAGYYISSVTHGTSFTIQFSSTFTGDVHWMIVNDSNS